MSFLNYARETYHGKSGHSHARIQHCVGVEGRGGGLDNSNLLNSDCKIIGNMPSMPRQTKLSLAHVPHPLEKFRKFSKITLS